MAAERQDRPPPSLIVRRHQHLVVVPITDEDGELADLYYVKERTENAQEKSRDRATLNAARAAIGSWSDLDWDEMLTELDRIRHERTPTPPIELDFE